MKDCISGDSEDRIHTLCYVFFHNTYPHLRGLLCYNLNNSKNKIDGNRNKAKGLRKGRSDLTLYYRGRTYFIEIKTPTGEQSLEQIEWQRKVEEQGFEYFIVRSLPEFQQLIFTILKK